MNDAQEHEWEDFEAQALMRWPELTEADLERAKEADQAFADILANRLGIDPTAAQAQIDGWMARIGAGPERAPA